MAESSDADRRVRPFELRIISKEFREEESVKDIPSLWSCLGLTTSDSDPGRGGFVITDGDRVLDGFHGIISAVSRTSRGGLGGHGGSGLEGKSGEVGITKRVARRSRSVMLNRHYWARQLPKS